MKQGNKSAANPIRGKFETLEYYLHLIPVLLIQLFWHSESDRGIIIIS